MATVKRIVSDEVHQPPNKPVEDIAKQAIFIDVDLHAPAGSEEMKWDKVGRPLFGDALKAMREKLPNDTEKDTTG